jgi:ABC-type amino acid transport substrate-binding protein
MKQFNLKRLAAAIATVTAVSAGAASAQEACTNYTVADGDTLATIAIAAYGSSNYQPIFNANRNIVTDPTSLDVGMVLALPCEDGSLPSGVSAAELIAQQEERNANVSTSNVYAPPMRLVTGGGWAPFTAEELKGGGFIVRLATTALKRGGNNYDHNVSFVNDWGSHLDSLLPLGAFDVTMAWYLPDCSDKSFEWGPETTKRCEGFIGSVPVYETVIGFYTLPDNKFANAQNFEDFYGSRLCRMNAWFVHDLEPHGLIDPNVTLVRPENPVECIEAVLNGTADVASFEVQSAAAAMETLGVSGDEIKENAFLTTVVSLHYLVHKTNPNGRKYIALLNKGLNEMRQSGEWYAIISDSLADQAKNAN